MVVSLKDGEIMVSKQMVCTEQEAPMFCQLSLLKKCFQKKKKKEIEATSANLVVQTATKVQFISAFILITEAYMCKRNPSVVIRE